MMTTRVHDEGQAIEPLMKILDRKSKNLLIMRVINQKERKLKCQLSQNWDDLFEKKHSLTDMLSG
jgi:hypothetical protein